MTFQTSDAAKTGAEPVFTPSQPVHDARRLTGRDGTAFIVLDGKAYTLRITKAGKLILTK